MARRNTDRQMVFQHAESGQSRARQALRRYRLRGGQRQHHGAYYEQ